MVQARDQFQLLYDSGHNLENTVIYLAQCHLELFEAKKAKQVLERVPTLDNQGTYLYALANFKSQYFETADSLLLKVTDTSFFDFQRTRKMFNTARQFYENSNGYYIQNLGKGINTPDREYSGIMFNNYNELAFTKREKQSGKVDQDGLAYEMIYATNIFCLAGNLTYFSNNNKDASRQLFGNKRFIVLLNVASGKETNL